MKPQAQSVTQIFILKMNWSIPWILPWRQYQPLNHNYYLPHWLRPSQHFSYPQDILRSFISSTSLFAVNFNRFWDVWPCFKGSALVHGVCGHLGSHSQWVECPEFDSTACLLCLLAPQHLLLGLLLHHHLAGSMGTELVPSGTAPSCPHQFCTGQEPYPE